MGCSEDVENQIESPGVTQCNNILVKLQSTLYVSGITLDFVTLFVTSLFFLSYCKAPNF